MRFIIGVSAAFGAGALIGAGLTRILVEDKLKKEYAASSASMRRAYEAARIDAETPVDLESDLIRLVPVPEDGVMIEGDNLTVPISERVNNVVSLPNDKQPANPYWDASQVATEEKVLISFAQLDEEDYYDEDGHGKEQLTMVFHDGQPQFFFQGELIENSQAMDMVGGTIVDDMREAVREGTPALWIRNNQTGTDYEVIFEQP